jgi:hypothetical protein
MRSRHLLTIVLWFSAVGLTGCSGVRYLGYLVAPDMSDKTIKAQFADLAQNRVALVVYADSRTRFEQPWAVSELSETIGEELRKNVKGITLVPSRDVLRYQSENVQWDTMDRTDLAKALGVRYVIYVSLLDFMTNQAGGAQMYQGHISAEISIWDATQAEAASRCWYCQELAVIYPENTAVGPIDQDEGELRYRTEKLFSQHLVWNFYDHKAPVQE